jgi:hypothetical protein
MKKTHVLILGGGFGGLYLLKLPRFEKKLRVALDWTLDIFFSKDFVQYLHERAPVLSSPSATRLSTRSCDSAS